jgi:hypothetical protein
MRKPLVFSMLSLQFALAFVAPVARAEDRPFAAPFVGIDWRVNGLAGHLSHGPGFQLGALLFHGHLKVGLAGFSRPGSLNPETFRVALDGTTYRGQSTLDLRSDGGVVGVFIAPRFTMPGLAWLDVELPILFGQGGFGFYLHGDDRDTPDGRRVSEWENELLDGRDASINLALDVGLRLSFRTAASWLRPYIGVHYTNVFGYDTFVRDDYSGFGGVAGVEVGGF